MNYQTMVEQSINAAVTAIKNAHSQDNKAFKTVAVSEPGTLDITCMPAAYILLDGDNVERKTKFQEEHRLKLIVSTLQVVTSNPDGDTEFMHSFPDGIMCAGLAYDALVADRTLTGKVSDLVIKRVDYGRSLLDTTVIFWGDIEVNLILRYAPGKPDETVKMQDVMVKEAGIK